MSTLIEWKTRAGKTPSRWSRHSSHVQQLSAAIDDALVRTFGPETLDYDRYRLANEFDNGPFSYAFVVSIQEVRQSLARSKAPLLEQAIENLRERTAEAEASLRSGDLAASFPRRSQSAFKGASGRVLVVHGHGGNEHPSPVLSGSLGWSQSFSMRSQMRGERLFRNSKRIATLALRQFILLRTTLVVSRSVCSIRERVGTSF